MKKKKLISSIIAVILILTLVGCSSDKPKEADVKEDPELQEAKGVVLDVYMDKIIISEPDNDFKPSELANYLRDKGYSEENIKKAIDYGNNVNYVGYHISKNIDDKSIEEIKKNLLDEKWLKDNNISSTTFTEEEIENGEKLYEYFKEIGVY